MREMIWVQSATHGRWTCSGCAWVFNPSGPPVGNSIEEMKENYERQGREEFVSHVCAQHPRTKGRGPGGKS